MTVLHKITHTIASAVGTIVSAPECIKEVVSVMTVSHSQWGDISFPCFSLAKNIQKSPHEIAEEIADKIVSIVPEIISARADNGYVNMTLDNAFLFQVIDAVRSAGAVYGMAPTDTPFTYIVEYASPNTNKPLHLGHMRNIALGQALIAF